MILSKFIGLVPENSVTNTGFSKARRTNQALVPCDQRKSAI